MALIKKTELKQMDEKRLNEKLLDLKKEMIKIRSQISTGTVPQNPGGIKEVKRTIARLTQKLSKKNIQKLEQKSPKEVKKKTHE